MNLFSSLKMFRAIAAEDKALAGLGVPRGRLLAMHYRGRWEQRRGLTPRLWKVSLRHFDRPVELSLSAPYAGAFKGVFLDEEYRCSSLLPVAPLRILDLGANIGMGTISFACQFPAARMVCVEPDPRNLSLLQQNLQANSVQALVVAAAVGAAPGHLNLRFGADPTCSALESSPMHQLQGTTSVDVTTIPALLLKAGWDSVDLLKVDIEGSEDELLSQNNGWLSQVGAVILEIHPSTTPEKIAGYLAPFGFCLRRVGHGREPVYFASRNGGMSPA